MGCHSLLQGIFPTQESKLGFLHCGQILYHLSHQGSPTHVYTPQITLHILHLPTSYRQSNKYCLVSASVSATLAYFWKNTWILHSDPFFFSVPWPHISVCKWIPSQLLSAIFYSKCLREGLTLRTAGTRNSPGPHFGSVNGKERWAAPRFPSPFGGGSSWQGPPLSFCFIPSLYFNTAKHSHWQPSPGWGIATPIWLWFWISGKGASADSICMGLLALKAKGWLLYVRARRPGQQIFFQPYAAKKEASSSFPFVLPSLSCQILFLRFLR